MSRLPIAGLHHVKLPVVDLTASREWWEALLGLTVEIEFCDADGTVRGVAYEPVGGLRLALRKDPTRAEALAGFDSVALGVETRADLEEVIARLDEMGTPHGPVIAATIGWLLAATGPNNQQLRFYTFERRTPVAT
ncbi:MAG: VOC family protein [Marmoricola sp.]|nr:VOC family protein [Marmoricola sp.]